MRILAMAVLVCGALVLSRAWAADAPAPHEDIEAVKQTTQKLIEALIRGGILTREQADALLEDARRSARDNGQSNGPANAANPKSKVVRVPYVPKAVREQIKAEIRRDVEATAREEKWGRPTAYPEWLERIRLYGDFRLRAQYNGFESSNGDYTNIQETNTRGREVLLNTTDDYRQYRFRMRLGLDARITQRSMVGLRLTTGSNANPVSANQTLGNTFNRSSLTLDRAFLKLDPRPWLTLTGGRIANPFLYSDLVWDDDLNFEGASVVLRPYASDRTKASISVGLFPLETLDCTDAERNARCGKDKWLYGLQLGAERRLGSGENRIRAGLAYYYYRNIAGQFNDPQVLTDDRSSLMKFSQKGNTTFDIVTQLNGPLLLGLAADFRLLNFTAQADLFDVGPYHVSVMGDYVKNIGYDREKIRRRTAGLVDKEARTTGYQARLTVGHPQLNATGKWQASLGYKYLQADAVVDSFTDSNFHLGGTDAKGWILGGTLGLGSRATLRARWFSSNEIDGPPLSIDVFQLDLATEF